MLIFQSRWSDHELAESGDGNLDNDPTRDYYLSRLILGSIRLLFCSNLIMDKLVFCPILVPGNKQFRKWRVCHWLPGIFVSILQIISFTRAENYCEAHFGFALASSVTPRQKETSKSVARCGLCWCCRPIISFGLGNVLCCQNYQGDYDFSNRRLQVATRYKVFQNNKRHQLWQECSTGVWQQIRSDLMWTKIIINSNSNRSFFVTKEF